MTRPPAEDVTVEFECQDGRRFETTSKQAYTKASALIPKDWAPPDVIHLSESSYILETLFMFIKPGRHPDLRNVSFDTLARITKAAEKYLVISAVTICRERMRSFIGLLPVHIFLYGVYYDCTEFVDKAAPLVVTKETLEKVVPLLPVDYRLTWVLFLSVS
ncbi:hypothetical protein D9756_011498 [Leucocoprinus leucothites]|nr:hypothetical protein D9756_011498 [Leucoagaricus leucothites]